MSSARASFGVSDAASPAEAQAVASAALRVLWADLAWFDIDLTGLLDAAETADAASALREYRSRKWMGRGLSENVRLYPGRNDDVLPAAQALVGRTIGSSGYAEPDRLIFDANDEGTSCWFELTEDQAADVVATLSRSGHASTLLVRAAR